jgi:mersacidin/lichenicidin family type 2 lantibiotic
MATKTLDVVRALKDVEYRESLSEEQRAYLPSSQAGIIELSNADMEEVLGAAGIAVMGNFLLAGSYSCTVSKGGGCHCHCGQQQLEAAGVYSP